MNARFRNWGAALALLVVTAGAYAAALPNGLYGINFGSTPTPFYSVDDQNGTATTLFDAGIFGSGLTYDSTRDRLIAADPAADKLFAIDRQTQQVTEIFSGMHLNSLAYAPDTDTIYAIASNPSDPLIAIDAATMQTTPLGDPGIGAVYALGYRTGENRLYAIGSQGISGGGYFTRFNNPANPANQTFIAQLNDQNVQLVRALAYDAANDRFFGSAVNSPFRSLISVAPTTGLATTIGSFGINNDAIYGLAVVTPEPTSALLLLGLAALAVRRR